MQRRWKWWSFITYSWRWFGLWHSERCKFRVNPYPSWVDCTVMWIQAVRDLRGQTSHLHLFPAAPATPASASNLLSHLPHRFLNASCLIYCWGPAWWPQQLNDQINVPVSMVRICIGIAEGPWLCWRESPCGDVAAVTPWIIPEIILFFCKGINYKYQG